MARLDSAIGVLKTLMSMEYTLPFLSVATMSIKAVIVESRILSWTQHLLVVVATRFSGVKQESLNNASTTILKTAQLQRTGELSTASTPTWATRKSPTWTLSKISFCL